MASSSITPHSDRPRFGWASAWGRYLWLTPLLLSMAFTALVVAWAQDNDRLERETLRRTVMADTLSLEAQLASRLETETVKLRAAATRLPAPGPDANRQLATLPEIAAGPGPALAERDVAGRRITASWPKRVATSAPACSACHPAQGITLHLVAPTSDDRMSADRAADRTL